MSGEALAWSYKNARNWKQWWKSLMFFKCTKKKKIHTHVHTHRLDWHMHLSYPLRQEVKLGERHDSRERREFFWRHPSIRKLRYHQQMDGLLEGYSGFHWPHKILRFVLQAGPHSGIINELQSPDKPAFNFTSRWNATRPLLEEDNELDGAFQLLLRMFTHARCRVCLCVFPALARPCSVTFETDPRRHYCSWTLYAQVRSLTWGKIRDKAISTSVEGSNCITIIT